MKIFSICASLVFTNPMLFSACMMIFFTKVILKLFLFHALTVHGDGVYQASKPSKRYYTSTITVDVICILYSKSYEAI